MPPQLSITMLRSCVVRGAQVWRADAGGLQPLQPPSSRARGHRGEGWLGVRPCYSQFAPRRCPRGSCSRSPASPCAGSAQLPTAAARAGAQGSERTPGRMRRRASGRIACGGRMCAAAGAARGPRPRTMRIAHAERASTSSATRSRTVGTSGLAAAEALSEAHTSGRYPLGPRSVSSTISAAPILAGVPCRTRLRSGRMGAIFRSINSMQTAR